MTTCLLTKVRAERDALAADNAKLRAKFLAALADNRQAWEYVKSADKTRYDYPRGSKNNRKPDGTPPPTGQCWLTPAEKARDMIKAIDALLAGEEAKHE